MNSQFDEHRAELKQIKSQIEVIQNEKIDTQQKFIQELVQKISQQQFELEEAHQKLKLRFDTFKKSQQGLNIEMKSELAEQSAEIQNILASIKILKQNEQSQSMEINEIKQEQKQLSEQVKVSQSLISTINQKNKIENNNDLLGKIHLNVSLSRFQNFNLIYDNYLTQNIALSTLDKLFKFATKNNQDPLICLGGLNISDMSQFLVVACDYASEVFQPTNDTTKARKSRNGNVYWYLVDYFSFGFSPSEKISLALCDVEEPESELRFSYWLSTRVRQGGRRIGKITDLQNSTDYKMRIYMLR